MPDNAIYYELAYAATAIIYLGYGLSQAIRRSSVPAPTEPCPALPLAACRVDAGAAPRRSDDFEIGMELD